MLYKRGKNSITRSAIYSIGLHLSLLLLTMISMLIPRKENNLLVDVEIAGEGEFREAMEKARQVASDDLAERNILEEVKEEPKATEENTEPQDLNNKPQFEKQIPEEKIGEPVPKEDLAPKIEEKRGEDLIPEVKKEEHKQKQDVVKKTRKRNKKSLMDVIKKAEAARKKKERRKKIRDLADKEAKRTRDSDFEKMLDNSGESNRKFSVKGNFDGSGSGQKGYGAGASGIGNGLNESDYEMVSSQIYPHWVVPSGVRDAENIIIEIHIELGDNGDIVPSSIKIMDEKRYATDYVFRAAADSARRAILQASPLSIPKEKIGMFREITLRFNLKEALGE